MSDGSPDALPPREAARERARELRTQQKKKDRRGRLLLQGGIVVGSLAIVAIVAIVLIGFARAPQRGPLNMISDGIKIGAGFKAERTAAVGPNSTPIPSAPEASSVIDIQLYVDYLCPNCGIFEQKNGSQIEAWVKSGAATLEVHPIAILTTKSAGTAYSMRAANAAACVAEFSPDTFYDFNSALFVNQPTEGSQGLSDDELIARATASGVTDLKDVSACINDKRFKDWVQQATVRALNGPIADSDVAAVTATPTIIVNGKQFKYTTAFDPNEFAQFVAQAAGEAFNANPTPTPTPTPSSTTAG